MNSAITKDATESQKATFLSLLKMMWQAWFNSVAGLQVLVILSSIGQQLLTVKERQEIELHLANYNIPVQILQMVAERCQSTIDLKVSGRDMAKKPKLSILLARLDDRSVILLKQMFLDCDDSLSNFRFAVFLSSTYSPMSHKFILGDAMNDGKSKPEYAFDVCIYSRQTEELVAVGMQNNNAKRQASSHKSLREFLSLVESLRTVHPGLRGAYYASSYGYDDSPSSSARKARTIKDEDNNKKHMEIKYLEYKNKIYFEK